MLGPGTLPSHFLLLLVMVDAKDGTVVISHHLLSFPENTLPRRLGRLHSSSFPPLSPTVPSQAPFLESLSLSRLRVPQDVVTV